MSGWRIATDPPEWDSDELAQLRAGKVLQYGGVQWRFAAGYTEFRRVPGYRDTRREAEYDSYLFGCLASDPFRRRTVAECAKIVADQRRLRDSRRRQET